MSIANRMREVMKSQNLSIKAFATLLEIPYRTIQNYLLNERDPSVEVLIKISEVLNVDLNWLMRGEGKMFCSYLNGKLAEKELDLISYYRMMSSDMQIAFDISFKFLSENLNK